MVGKQHLTKGEEEKWAINVSLEVGVAAVFFWWIVWIFAVLCHLVSDLQNIKNHRGPCAIFKTGVVENLPRNFPGMKNRSNLGSEGSEF